MSDNYKLDEMLRKQKSVDKLRYEWMQSMEAEMRLVWEKLDEMEDKIDV